jgi:hypothetical protein
MRFRFLSILIVTVISLLLTCGYVWAEDPYFIESGGVVSMEAENYSSNNGYVFMSGNTINTGGQVAQCPGYPNRPAAGFSGRGYMARNKVGQSITYRIKFTTTGRYYVNMRTWADFENYGGSCYNGFCFLWNGVEVVSGCPANGIYVTKRAEWQWDTEKSIGETRQGAVIVNVPSPGMYTLTVYPKKEWYTWHDKIVLRHTSLCANNPCPTTVTFNCFGCNSGTGVPESQRSTDPTPSAPTATTSAATSVSAAGATLNGTVNPNGESTAVVFDYGTTTNYGTTASATQSPLSGSTSQPVSAQVSGLTPGTTYHFRVRATNSGGTGTGSDLSFTAGDPVKAPTAKTGEATSVLSNSAILNGMVNPYDASTAVVFDYGTTTNYGATAIATQSPVAGSKPRRSVPQSPVSLPIQPIIFVPGLRTAAVRQMAMIILS